MSLDLLHRTDWILMGVLGSLFLIQFYWYIRYMAAPARRIRKDKKNKVQRAEVNVPGVSVILCAHNESENLSNYLQSLLTQD